MSIGMLGKQLTSASASASFVEIAKFATKCTHLNKMPHLKVEITQKDV